ncbi:MAG: amidohydrolase family protein, partial [Clostridiales Family XIII bacterium]|nr:amidohydrolase family protein [Clostridiales Family XIII bacterium]
MGYDLILNDANFITADKDMSRCAWAAVKDGRIAALGTDPAQAPPGARTLDLAGNTVLPGLMDCHVHVLLAGLNLSAVDLQYAGDVGEVLALLGKRCAETDEEWVFGMNYVTQNIKEQRYPDRFELDAVSGDKKLMVMAATLHGCATNTAAMRVCAVAEDMPGVERQADGQVTGIYTSDESSFLANANALGDLPD